MAFNRGEIRLANFNPSKGTEAGKTRPCLIIQSNFLNIAEHPSTTVIPLTTKLIPNVVPLRLHLPARDGLRADSDIMIDQLRTIDNQRFKGEVLTKLKPDEMAKVEEFLKITLGFEPA